MSRTLHHTRVPAAERKVRVFRPTPRRQGTRVGIVAAHLREL
jgi:hypothetical protein